MTPAPIPSPCELAIITGASSGGRELASVCAKKGFDLLVAADDPAIHDAAGVFRGFGAAVDAVEGRARRMTADVALAGFDAMSSYQRASRIRRRLGTTRYERRVSGLSPIFRGLKGVACPQPRAAVSPPA